MVNERDNPKIFEEAYSIGQQYFGQFEVILNRNHIMVIGKGIIEEFECIEIHENHSLWHSFGKEQPIIQISADSNFEGV